MPEPVTLTALVAQTLRDIRVAHGLSLDEVASKAGVHRTSLGLIERGKRGMTLEVATRICQALGVSLSEIVRQAEIEHAAMS